VDLLGVLAPDFDGPQPTGDQDEQKYETEANGDHDETRPLVRGANTITNPAMFGSTGTLRGTESPSVIDTTNRDSHNVPLTNGTVNSGP
jgi:hypothetical protein